MLQLIYIGFMLGCGIMLAHAVLPGLLAGLEVMLLSVVAMALCGWNFIAQEWMALEVLFFAIFIPIAVWQGARDIINNRK